MARRAEVPEELTRGPFSLVQARQAGLSRAQLRSANWRRLAAGLYVFAGLASSPIILLQAYRGRLPQGAVFSGNTAAWLHGIDVPADEPVEITIPYRCPVSDRAGMFVRRSTLSDADVDERRGLPVTSRLRTVFDLARHLTLVEAVVAIDMALHRRLVADVKTYVAAHPRLGGITQARRAVDLVHPAAESPMETRLRMLLVMAGLPRPDLQVPLRDDRGVFIARPDLYYPTQRVAIEYDGGTHRDRLAEDDRRQNRLLGAGFQLLRFTASDVYNSPETIVAQVRAALKRRRATLGLDKVRLNSVSERAVPPA